MQTSFIDISDTIRAIANSDDRRLAVEFLIVFSRFEYALKRAGFAKGDAKGVEADWDSFAQKWHSRFKDRLNGNPVNGNPVNAWTYFSASPPQKQVKRNGQLDWDLPELDTQRLGSGPDLMWLLLMIRRIRNNLFHGGQFGAMQVSDPSRDRELLEHALSVLQECLRLDADVLKEFIS